MAKKINVGIIGVGNCFSGLMQGIELYRTTLANNKPTGLMHEKMGGYSIFDIDFVAAWDVGENKIGQPLTKAIFAEPNMVHWLSDSYDNNKVGSIWWKEHKKVIVQEAPVLDGVGLYVENKIKPKRFDQQKVPADILEQIKKTIKEKKIDVLVNYLPVGSQQATEWWANIAIGYNVAFLNCMPVFIASDPVWAKRFKDAGVPVVGDDMKGQVGATIVHRVLAKLVNDRGTRLEKTYQLNVGGNTDFLNMKEQERLKSKKESKTSSVQSQLDKELDAESIHIGPSDYIPFLSNTKVAYIRLEGKQFAEIPYTIETRLEVDDKSNSAGVVIDAVRLAKIAKDRGEGGPVVEASAYLFKHPPVQFSDIEAKQKLEDYINDKPVRGGRSRD